MLKRKLGKLGRFIVVDIRGKLAAAKEEDGRAKCSGWVPPLSPPPPLSFVYQYFTPQFQALIRFATLDLNLTGHPILPGREIYTDTQSSSIHTDTHANVVNNY